MDKVDVLYTYTMEYYSAKKRMKFTAILVDLENIMLSKIREREILYDITHMWSLKKKMNVYSKIKKDAQV